MRIIAIIQALIGVTYHTVSQETGTFSYSFNSLLFFSRLKREELVFSAKLNLYLEK